MIHKTWCMLVCLWFFVTCANSCNNSFTFFEVYEFFNDPWWYCLNCSCSCEMGRNNDWTSTPLTDFHNRRNDWALFLTQVSSKHAEGTTLQPSESSGGTLVSVSVLSLRIINATIYFTDLFFKYINGKSWSASLTFWLHALHWDTLRISHIASSSI